MKRLLAAALLCLLAAPLLADDKDTDGWKTIFDGKSLDGWKINENKDSWKLEDGVLIAHGPRSHIFYVGDDKPFKNFELKVEVKTKPGSNGGIFFHTKYQDSDWPAQGIESQVNISQGDPQKTGGLYNLEKVLKAPAEDDKWWTQDIIVKDKHVTVKIDDKTVVEYDEPADKKGADGKLREKLSEGTFALQAHDPGSTVMYRNIRVKRLP
jgi:hypothetical protein